MLAADSHDRGYVEDFMSLSLNYLGTVSRAGKLHLMSLPIVEGEAN
jgi:hypothetical protein